MTRQQRRSKSQYHNRMKRAGFRWFRNLPDREVFVRRMGVAYTYLFGRQLRESRRAAASSSRARSSRPL
jgi:hypothetical protein